MDATPVNHHRGYVHAIIIWRASWNLSTMFSKVSYEKCLSTMKQIEWKLDDVFKTDQKIDFSRMFLPCSLVAHDINDDILDEKQLLMLNHITTHSYLHFFFFIEEFIVAKSNQLSHHTPTYYAQQALHHFCSEEIKHQYLFKRIKKVIKEGVGYTLKVVNIQKSVAKELMGTSDIAALLFILHLEIITQDHYLHSIKIEHNLEPTIVRVLKKHWIEESQHAKLDFLQLTDFAKTASSDRISSAIEEYIVCLKKLKDVFRLQAELDIEVLVGMQNTDFDMTKRNVLEKNQFSNYVEIFIKKGMRNIHLNNAITLLFGKQSQLFHQHQQDPSLYN